MKEAVVKSVGKALHEETPSRAVLSECIHSTARDPCVL